MKNKVGEKKGRLPFYVLLLSILVIGVVVIYGLRRETPEVSSPLGSPISDASPNVYYLEDHIVAEFSDVIIERMQKESRLIVSSVDASVTIQIRETGMFDLDILNKSQDITYQGTGQFYLDLGRINAKSIQLDNASQTVTIVIPRTQLEEIRIDPKRFSSGATAKGFLAFGDIRFTAEEYNALEVECKNRITAAVDTKENRDVADRNAIEEMTRLYEPIVKAVDDTYRVNVIFEE